MDFNVIMGAIQGIVSLAIAVAAFYYARKKDTHETSTQGAKMMTQLEGIRRDVEEMKDNVKEMRREWHEDHDKIVSMERDIKAIWRQVDKINGKENRDAN